MARPKSEGFVRRKEAKRRATAKAKPSGTYVRAPQARTPAQKAQVKRDTPKPTRNATLAKTARKKLDAAKRKEEKVVFGSDAAWDKAYRNQLRRSWEYKSAVRDNNLEFLTRLGAALRHPMKQGARELPTIMGYPDVRPRTSDDYGPDTYFEKHKELRSL